MTSAQALERSALSPTHIIPNSLSSVAPRWILANVLPQAVLVAAAGVYLSVNGMTFVRLITKESLERPANAGWALLALAAVYLVMMVWMRGAVLRPLVPRFSLLAWLPVAVLSGAAMLLAAVGGGLTGIAVAKGMATATSAGPTAPTGLGLVPFVFGEIIGAEFIGLIVGGLPGLIFGAGEALAAFKGPRRKAAWTLWTAGAWATIATIITLHALLIVTFPALPSGALAALAGATPILLGLAAALLTLPALAKLARQQSSA